MAIKEKGEIVLFNVPGRVIYHYDFPNEKGIQVCTTKVLFYYNGLTLYLNSKKFNDNGIGTEIKADLGYNGKEWYVI